MKKILGIILLSLSVICCNSSDNKDYSRYINQSTYDYVIVVDFSIHSGKNRFFMFNKDKQLVLKSLCEHGCGNGSTKKVPKFSNKIGSNCSSLGKFKVSGYNIMRDKTPSYLLDGLDSTNSNAKKRHLLIHPYYIIPDFEIYPIYLPTSYSQGCFIISPIKFKIFQKYIKNKKVILYSIYQ